ncbi:MAG: hypothetical protein WKF71_11810 [Pyrinomonadaceae bacterium]
MTQAEYVKMLYDLQKTPAKKDEVVEAVRARGIAFELTDGLRGLTTSKSRNDAELKRALEEAERRRQNPTTAKLPTEKESTRNFSESARSDSGGGRRNAGFRRQTANRALRRLRRNEQFSQSRPSGRRRQLSRERSGRLPSFVGQRHHSKQRAVKIKLRRSRRHKLDRRIRNGSRENFQTGKRNEI